MLVDTNDYQKIQHITPTTGFVYAGMGPDFRVLVSNARKEAQKYFLMYREGTLILIHSLTHSLTHLLTHSFITSLVQPVSQVVKESALLMQEYTQSGGVRPFGVSCLVAGYDNDGPQLFQVDPSGNNDSRPYPLRHPLTHSIIYRLGIWLESNSNW